MNTFIANDSTVFTYRLAGDRLTGTLEIHKFGMELGENFEVRAEALLEFLEEVKNATTSYINIEAKGEHFGCIHKLDNTRACGRDAHWVTRNYPNWFCGETYCDLHVPENKNVH